MRVVDTAGLAVLVASVPCPYRYEVSALADPGVLPRLLELVAKRGLVPTEMTAHRHGGADGEDRLSVSVGVDGVEPMAAEHIAQCMTQVVGVEAVAFRRLPRAAAA
ncbi:MAG: hypothetical protein H6842_01255 [Rhodospirillaceae bacterium]|nr:hypothetical protein [Rhodospirillaceae bacterium]